nr:MAG TPA: hypothetical protein [Caudoviricetes sp.]
MDDTVYVNHRPNFFLVYLSIYSHLNIANAHLEYYKYRLKASRS